jgi:hypothetical protein
MAFFLHRGENGYWRRGDSEGAYTVHCQNKQDYSVSNLLFKYFSCICSKLIQNYSLPFYGGMGQTTEYTQLATAAFWRTFYHDGKIAQAGEGGGGGARPPPFTISTITNKVAVYAPAESADTLPFISTPMV